MTFLIGLALKAGIGERFARPFVVVLLILLTVAALAGGKCAYDASVIDRHEDRKAVKDLRNTIKRERKANAEDVKAEARDEANNEKLEGAIANAVEAKPVEARKPAGPA